MKLQKADKKILHDLGYSENDFRQIEEAAHRATYKLTAPGGSEAITWTHAYAILGRSAFLSGIARAAFHHTATRELGEHTSVHFDASKLFEKKGEKNE